MRALRNSTLAVLLTLACLSQAACAQTPNAINAPTEDLTPGWQNDTVFYLAFVRSFADSATGPLANDGVGDLQGLIENLDYLNDGDPATTTDLGVTGLWLMPITQAPSYHGYDAADYRTIHDEYGTNDDMRRLVAECHKRGIRVLFDLVLNHCSDQHPWFVESMDPDSSKRDWFVWEDAKPDQRGPWGQPVWHTVDVLGIDPPEGEAADDAYYGVFFHGMPDLNFKNPEVTAEMKRVAEFWLNDIGVDGFRLDAIKYLIENGDSQENDPATIAWLKDFNEFVQTIKPGAFTVAEVWDSPEQIARYIDPDPTSGSAAADSAFDFPFAYAVMEGLRDGDIERIRKDLARSFKMLGSRSSTFISNHDMDRSMPFMGNSVPRAKAAASLLLTAHGSPFVYYGEELGMIGKGPHENIRTPMQWTTDRDTAGFTTGTPWQPPHPGAGKVSVQSQTGDPDSLLSHYRTLIRLRTELPALRRGDFSLTTPDDNRVVSYIRTIEDQRVLIIVNGTDRVVTDFRIDATQLNLDPSVTRTDLITSRPISKPLPNHLDQWRPIPSIRPYATHLIVLDN